MPSAGRPARCEMGAAGGRDRYPARWHANFRLKAEATQALRHFGTRHLGTLALRHFALPLAAPAVMEHNQRIIGDETDGRAGTRGAARLPREDERWLPRMTTNPAGLR